MKIIDNLAEARSRLDRRGKIALPEASAALLQRLGEAFGPGATVESAVAEVLAQVRARGDEALLELGERLDGVRLASVQVGQQEKEAARREVPEALASALRLAADRIRSFHVATRRSSWVDFAGGLGQLVSPLERVGIYAPGGTATYPSTVLMAAIPARVAGVPRVYLATPPRKDGTIPPSVLLAAELAQVDAVFKVGGAQAVAALAFGTRTVPKVDKVCGPGNIFVTVAKKLVFGLVDIDGLYGPTETLIIADASASARLVALDLLAQAEHDPLATAILVTPSRQLLESVQLELAPLVAGLERGALAKESLEQRGALVLTPDLDTALELANTYAPEHLALMVRDPWSWVGKVRNAGGVFLDCPEALGDYTAGPSHVMPTGGTAFFRSPLRVDDFLKTTSLMALDRKALEALGPAAATIARAEGLTAHALSLEERLKETK